MCVHSLLVFDKRIREEVDRAYMMLGIIKRNFVHVSRKRFVTLYKALVRSHLEYANSVWHPKRKADVDKLEGVQKRDTQSIQKLSKNVYRTVKNYKFTNTGVQTMSWGYD